MLKRVFLRSAVEAVDSLEDEKDDNEISSSAITKNFIELGSIVVIAASHSSFNTVWFIEVKDTSCFGANCDGYGNIFDEGTTYLAGHFLEKISETEMKQTFQLISKTAYFHKESILHPYVQFTESKKGLVLENLHYMEILQYIEQNNFLQLQLFTINCYCWYYMLVNFLSIFTFMLFSCSLDILTSQVLLAFIKEYLVHLYYIIFLSSWLFVYIGSTDLLLFAICYCDFSETINTEEPQWCKMSYFSQQLLVLQVLWITMVDSSKKVFSLCCNTGRIFFKAW